MAQAIVPEPRHRILKSIVLSALVLVPAAFIFQITQTWITSENTLDKGLFIWLIPAGAALLYLLVASVVLLLRENKSLIVDTPTEFRRSALQYAEALAANQQDHALLELQDNLGWIFHSQSANADRITLGTLAAEAAVRAGNVEQHVNILIDDLGWAEHMAGDDEKALNSLDHALDLLGILPINRLTPNLRLAKAKALRHKALIVAPTNLLDARRYILEAEQEVTAGTAGRQRSIEIGQLRHAKGLAILLNLRLTNGQHVPADDPVAVAAASEALALARDARQRFDTPGNWQLSRMAKAIYLEQSLLAALGKQLEADEAGVVLADVLRRSTWNANEFQLNMKGLQGAT